MSCKNLRPAERLLRGLLGAAIVGGGLGWGGVAPIGLALAAAGIGVGLTGLLGCCPAYAMIGRRS